MGWLVSLFCALTLFKEALPRHHYILSVIRSSTGLHRVDEDYKRRVTAASY